MVGTLAARSTRGSRFPFRAAAESVGSADQVSVSAVFQSAVFHASNSWGVKRDAVCDEIASLFSSRDDYDQHHFFEDRYSGPLRIYAGPRRLQAGRQA